MDSEAALTDLCTRYGVPLPFGRRLMPLLRRAERAPAEQRRFLLDLVERSFAREAQRRQRGVAYVRAEEERALEHLAATLHDWSPPDWFKRWVVELGGTSAFDADLL